MKRYMLVYYHPDLGEQRFEIREGATYRLGSRSSADIVIPQRDVSRNHALLRVGEHGLHITDLDSKNGTFVNSQRVSAAEFSPGDRLQISSAELMVLEVSSGTFALAEEIQAAGTTEGESSGGSETLRFRKESEPADLVVLLEDLASYLERRELAGLLRGVQLRFGLRSIMLFFRDPGGRLALVSSSGELPDAGTFHEAFRDLLLSLTETGGDPACSIHQLKLGDEVFLMAGVCQGYCVVLGCDEHAPATNDLRAVVAAFRVVASVQETAVDSTAISAYATPREADIAGRILGDSRAIAACRKLASEFAKQGEPVLITGESGTGKELFARAIHELSSRSGGPFVPVNCAAIPADLTEAELFGVAPGAATGVSERPGRFHAAQGGTLFLDEIGELPDALQAKLLRVLEFGEVYRVGDDHPTTYDVRIISATNRRIEEAVQGGEFRADLFYRLHVLHLHVPPLRERRNDIPILVNAFLEETSSRLGKRVGGITVRALEALKRWSWPGNVRELRSEIIRMVALATPGAVIDLEQLSPRFGARDGGDTSTDLESLLELPLSEARDELERRIILRALEETGGNQSRAAQRLGISRAGLFKKMRRLGL